MSVQVVGAYSLLDIAAFLNSIGTFPTLEQAYQAVVRDPQFFHDIAIRDGIKGPAAVIRKVVGGAPPSVVSPTETALQLAGNSDLLAAPQQVKTGVIGIKEIPGVGGNPPSYGPTALMGIDLGIGGAILAPLLGVALGVNLYEQNPMLWTKISNTLLPFCYPDSYVLPSWAEVLDDVWQASLPKAALDALRDLFIEEGIPVYDGTPPGDYRRDPSVDNSPFSQPVELKPSFSIRNGSQIITWTTDGDGVVALQRTSNPNDFSITGVAKTSGKHLIRTVTSSSGTTSYSDVMQRSTVIDGKTVWWYPQTWTSSTRLDPYSATGYSDGSDPKGRSYWIAEYGQQVSPSGYPPGTEYWDGDIPFPVPESTPLVIGTDPQTGTPITQPMIPVSLPIPAPKVTPGQPQPSPDPEEQPDPTEITDPEDQIEPYIMPLPVPDEESDPTIQPEPDPEEDPSRPVDDPPQKIVDVVPLPPAPTGISPWPSLPTTPSWFDTDVGMVTVYHPTPAQFYAFCRWLWVTLSQATIETVWNNPFDGVITAYELYCTPTDNGYRNIHSGFLDSGINSATISRYTEINCGTVGIPEYYGTYFDYSPYSKAHVYLPFIGIQELNVDDIVGHAVNITYRIDEYNGACIAMITVAKVTEVNGEDVEYSNTMYQFSGNCSVELPMAGGSQAQIKAGLMMADATRQAALIGAGADLLGGLGSLLNLNLGGLLGGLGSAAYTLAQGEVSALGHMLSGKSTVQKSGSFGTSHGALGIKTPFIVVTRPKQIAVANYNELYGYPAHKMVTVGACTGFIRCREIHVYSPTATDEEKSMIEALFKSGVYVTE